MSSLGLRIDGSQVSLLRDPDGPNRHVAVHFHQHPERLLDAFPPVLELLADCAAFGRDYHFYSFYGGEAEENGRD